MPGYPDYGGTPVVTGSALLINANGVTVGQHLTSIKTAMISRPGYILQIEAHNSTSSAVSMPVQVEMAWTDTGTNSVIDRQIFWILAGSTANLHYVDGRGPTAGDKISVEITNFCASADTLTYSLLLLEVSHTFAQHDWRTDDSFSFSPAGWTPLDDDMLVGVLCGAAAVSLTAGASRTIILPFYSGPVFLMFTTASGTTDLTATLTVEAEADIAAPYPAWQGKSDANGNLTAQAWLPRAECAVTVKNGNAGTQAVSISIITAPRPG
jgi:hypothetical protein